MRWCTHDHDFPLCLLRANSPVSGVIVPNNWGQTKGWSALPYLISLLLKLQKPNSESRTIHSWSVPFLEWPFPWAASLFSRIILPLSRKRGLFGDLYSTLEHILLNISRQLFWSKTIFIQEEKSGLRSQMRRSLFPSLLPTETAQPGHVYEIKFLPYAPNIPDGLVHSASLCYTLSCSFRTTLSGMAE